MQDLIERLEKATGPAVELDEAIRVAVGTESICYSPGEGLVTTDDCYGPPEYTASIDAALTLVPEGKVWGVTSEGSAIVDTPHDYWEDNFGMGFYEKGATPAIALCIAALKARLATGTTDTHRDHAPANAEGIVR